MSDSYDFRAQRLHVTAGLDAGVRVALTREQVNYLVNVLRLPEGAVVHVFNGREGEWRARLVREGRRDASLAVDERIRAQTGGMDVHYLFAPLKRSRLDYMVQKATELGVARLQAVITRHTVAERVNLDRMRANVIEAAEQCGILRIPEVLAPMPLTKVMGQWEPLRTLVFCDEEAPVADPIRVLEAARPGPVAVLIGPEGGFAEEERALLLGLPHVVRLALGSRIMRADTAAVAALALVNAAIGDWRSAPDADAPLSTR